MAYEQNVAARGDRPCAAVPRRFAGMAPSSWRRGGEGGRRKSRERKRIVDEVGIVRPPSLRPAFAACRSFDFLLEARRFLLLFAKLARGANLGSKRYHQS